jgi:rhamnogalacturonyl hydrolase YesR
MQALLSLDTPSFSALNSTVPPSTKPPSSLSDVLSSAKSVLSNAPSGNGPHSLFPDDGSAADPASTGIGLLIANWTGQSGDYAGALESEVDFLLNKAPRSSKGAISHRTSQAQLWFVVICSRTFSGSSRCTYRSDFIYMVPPFLAYYGVTTGNQSMVQEAHTQVGLYRDALRDGKAHNLWHHIVGGDGGTDAGHWSTGNAWAAAGMLRVLGTIQHGPFAGALKGEAGDLQNWVGEIHDGMFRHVQPSGLFLNYADAQPAQSFEDAAATALLVASVYRLNLLTGQSKHLSQADQMRQTLFASNGTHVDSDGWLTPVVDPEHVVSRCPVTGMSDPYEQECRPEGLALARGAGLRARAALGIPRLEGVRWQDQQRSSLYECIDCRGAVNDRCRRAVLLNARSFPWNRLFIVLIYQCVYAVECNDYYCTSTTPHENDRRVRKMVGLSKPCVNTCT